MKCEQCRALVEDYLDGELDPSMSDQLDAHIANCNACAGLAAGIRQEHELYTLYRRDVDVTPALWSAVHARIAVEKRIGEEKHGRLAVLWEWLRVGFGAPRLSPRLAVALVIVATGITVGVMSYLQSRDQNHGQVANGHASAGDPKSEDKAEAQKSLTPGPVDLPPPNEEKQRVSVRKNRPAVSDPDRLVREAEQKYRVAIGILQRGLKDRRRQLDPETRTQFDIALAQIDQTIEATRVAVRRNPTDPIAVGYLLAAYSKKVDFLRDTARDDTEVNRPF